MTATVPVMWFVFRWLSGNMKHDSDEHIEAIGDARVLEDAFRRSEGGAWVEGLAQHYGVQWSIGRVGEVALPADPGLGVDRARTRR